jgi:hypothetical protein
MFRKLVLMLVFAPVLVLAQEAENVDVWEPFRYFVGEWSGTGSGPSGNSTIHTEFKFVLGGNFLHVTNRSIFPPQEQNPSGETHEDLGLVSYDKARRKFVLRQFHVEGFVNQYVLDSLSPDGKTLVFNSESLENAPSGMRAKWILSVTGDNEFHTSFELAMPGRDFVCFSENELQRKM